jgi:hypothetical protein
LQLSMTELIHLTNSAQNLTFTGIFKKPQQTRRCLTPTPQLCARKGNLPRRRKYQPHCDPEREPAHAPAHDQDHAPGCERLPEPVGERDHKPDYKPELAIPTPR